MRGSGRSSALRLPDIAPPSSAPGLSHGGGEGRYDFEEISYDPVVGHFEYGRIFVLVDCNYRLGSLHAYQVLDGAGNINRDVHLGRDCLSGTAALTFHGQPAVIADRPRGGQFGAQRG